MLRSNAGQISSKPPGRIRDIAKFPTTPERSTAHPVTCDSAEEAGRPTPVQKARGWKKTSASVSSPASSSAPHSTSPRPSSGPGFFISRFHACSLLPLILFVHRYFFLASLLCLFRGGNRGRNLRSLHLFSSSRTPDTKRGPLFGTGKQEQRIKAVMAQTRAPLLDLWHR